MALQPFLVKKTPPLPRLRRSFNALPCALLFKGTIDQAAQMLAVSPMVKLKRIDGAREAQPEDVRLKS